MSWSAPRTWATSEIVTAANMNTYISNNLSYLGGAIGARILTKEGTLSTTYVDLATPGPAVTVTTQTSALVFLSAQFTNGATGGEPWMSFAVSGATASTANDTTGVFYEVFTGSSVAQYGTAIYLSGLTAGANTFTAKYHTTGLTAASFSNRYIAVVPLTA